MKTVNVRHYKKKQLLPDAELDATRYEAKKAKAHSCFYEYNNKDRIVIGKAGLGEQNALFQYFSTFR